MPSQPGFTLDVPATIAIGYVVYLFKAHARIDSPRRRGGRGGRGGTFFHRRGAERILIPESALRLYPFRSAFFASSR